MSALGPRLVGLHRMAREGTMVQGGRLDMWEERGMM